MAFPMLTQSPYAGAYRSVSNIGPSYMPTADPDMIWQEQATRDPNSAFSRQLAAAQLPHQLQQQRFNTILPYLTGQLNFSSQVGGQSTPGPAITAGPVWNPQQVQQQVNSARAGADQRAQTNIRGMRQGMSSRGFGSQSPLAQALTAQYQGQGLAQGMGAERQIRWGAAQGNAQQTLQSQQAREQQHTSRMQEDIERRRMTTGYRSALLGALSGLV